MKRLMVHLSIALVAFLVGIASDVAFSRYVEVASPKVFDYFPTQPELIGLATPLPSETFATHLPPGSLAAELQLIDDTYRRRCHVPTDWYGGWPTIRQLDRFSTCNDEWATARRRAIKAEFDNYLVQY